MSERQKQTVFLKTLLEKEDTEQRRLLGQRIAKAERDEKCIRAAMFWVGLLALLCCSGLCYEAVFVQDFFQNPTHVATRVLCCLGLGSVICLVAFLAFWFWHRALANRLHEECRRMLMSMADSSARGAMISHSPALSHDGVPKEDTQTGTPEPAVQFRQAV